MIIGKIILSGYLLSDPIVMSNVIESIKFYQFRDNITLKPLGISFSINSNTKIAHAIPNPIGDCIITFKDIKKARNRKIVTHEVGHCFGLDHEGMR